MAKYKINKGYIVQKLDNKTVIFDGEQSVLYTFNETASFIFQKIKSAMDDYKIIEVLANKYSITASQAKNDLQRLIKDLKRKKIIT